MPSDRVATDMLSLLDIEELDTNLYRGYNEQRAADRPALFGGQVAAQALMAAARTVPEPRLPHSLHGYFLRPGSPAHPVILQVARDRDGRSFSARHVVALQGGEVIFSMSASFHHGEEGPEFPVERQPLTTAPEDLAERRDEFRFEHMLRICPFPPGPAVWRRRVSRSGQHVGPGSRTAPRRPRHPRLRPRLPVGRRVRFRGRGRA